MGKFRLWLEDLVYVDKNIDQNKVAQHEFPPIFEVENLGTIQAFHLSKVPFDEFDDERLGSNTMASKGKLHNKFSLDSFLGHQFVEDPKKLVNYPNREKLLGHLLYKVNLNLNKTAKIDIQWTKAKIKTPEKAQAFKKELTREGFDSVRLFDVYGDYPNALASNTIVVFNTKNVKIRSVINLNKNPENPEGHSTYLQAKHGPFVDQITKIRSNPSQRQTIDTGDLFS